MAVRTHRRYRGNNSFVMPAIPDEFFIPLTTAKGGASGTAEFQHLLNHPSVLAARGIAINDAQRYTLVREIASALAFLHRHRVCVGDISPKNLLFALIPHEAAYFIDCDAMRINGTSVQTQVETPGWQAPAGEELATVYTDTYKLGLLALRLPPATSTPPTRPTSHRHTTHAPPDHHRHPHQATPTTPVTRSLDLRPGQRDRKSPTQPKDRRATPVSAAPEAPPTPVVHSRPPARSAPPVGPSAPPVPQPRPAGGRPPRPAPRHGSRGGSANAGR